jgi:hypothetical protein
MALVEELKAHLLNEEEILKLETAIRAAGEVKLHVDSVPIKNPPCNLPIEDINQHIDVINAAYNDFDFPTCLSQILELTKKGVDWMGYLHGRQALSDCSVHFTDPKKMNYIYSAAKLSISLAPSESSGYLAMAVCHYAVSQPNQAGQWLRLAALCPNCPKLVHEQFAYQLEWWIRSSACAEKEDF